MNIHPDTPVMVEWWVHRRIPSTHHAVIVPYSKAVEWFKNGGMQPCMTMQCFTIDGNLLEELFDERRPQAY